jgi:hypothetical protein
MPSVSSNKESSGIFVGKDGELYYSIYGYIYKVAGGATRATAWRWTSRDIGFGNTSQWKKVYKIQGNTVGTFNGSGDGFAYDEQNNDTFIQYSPYVSLTVPSQYRKRKVLQIKIGGGATHKVSSLEVIFRRLDVR